jgi:hypothetical protein
MKTHLTICVTARGEPGSAIFYRVLCTIPQLFDSGLTVLTRLKRRVDYMPTIFYQIMCTIPYLFICYLSEIHNDGKEERTREF